LQNDIQSICISPSIIAWSDFLQMLEGDTMHLTVPKSFMQKDILFDKDTPFFATADGPLVLIKGGSIDQINTDMMKVRWNHFNFWRKIPQEQQRQMKFCGRCQTRTQSLLLPFEWRAQCIRGRVKEVSEATGRKRRISWLF